MVKSQVSNCCTDRGKTAQHFLCHWAEGCLKSPSLIASPNQNFGAPDKCAVARLRLAFSQREIGAIDFERSSPLRPLPHKSSNVHKYQNRVRNLFLLFDRNGVMPWI